MVDARAVQVVALSTLAAYSACGGISERSVNETADGSGGGATVDGGSFVSTVSASSGPSAGFVGSGAGGGPSFGANGAGGGAPFGAGGAVGADAVSITIGSNTTGAAGGAGAPSVGELCQGQCEAVVAAAEALDCESQSLFECVSDCEVSADVIFDYGCDAEFVNWASCIGDLEPEGFACYLNYGVSPEGCVAETYEMFDCIYANVDF